MDDATALAAWVRDHDETAFACLVRNHATLVSGICRRFLGEGAADEAAQAVFIILARHADRVVDPISLGPWLHGVAIRICRKAQRAAARRAHHEQRAASLLRPDAGSDPMTAWNDLRPHLDEAISTLSSPQRAAVVGHFLEGLTQSAVAERLGISEEAAHQRIHYALGKLRTWFGKRGMVVSAGALAVGLAGEASAAEPTMIASCTQAALHPAVVPGASALAGGVLTASAAKITALAAAVLLVAIGGIVARQAMQAAPEPAVVTTTPRKPPADPRPAAPTSADPLLAEDFEDDGFQARGWYDNPQGFILSSAEHAPGSRHAAEFRFLPGSEVPTSGGASRRLFAATKSLRISYWITYGADWVDAEHSSCMNQIVVLTTEDDRWETPNYTHLTCAIGVIRGIPFVALQDARNIDVGRVGQDLTAITEQRAIAGGNDGNAGPGYCTPRQDGKYWNEKRYLAAPAMMTDHPGPFFQHRWHHIEVRLVLNRIVDGKGVPDGRMSYAVDGTTVMDQQQVLFRTGQHPDMRFNQLIIAPWMDGSHPGQSFWIDDLTLSTDADRSAIPNTP